MILKWTTTDVGHPNFSLLFQCFLCSAPVWSVASWALQPDVASDSHILIALLICSLALLSQAPSADQLLLYSLLMKTEPPLFQSWAPTAKAQFKKLTPFPNYLFEGDSSLDKGLGDPRVMTGLSVCLAACHIMFRKHNSNVTDSSSRQTDGVALCASLRELHPRKRSLSVSLPAHHHARPGQDVSRGHERRGPPPSTQSSRGANRGFLPPSSPDLCVLSASEGRSESGFLTQL